MIILINVFNNVYFLFILCRKILSDVEFCEREFKTLMERFQARLLTLHETVKYRTAIPIVQVYVSIVFI